MSLLTLVQDVSKRIGLPTPSFVYNNTDNTVMQLVALLKLCGDELLERVRWAELTRTGSITLVAGQATYAVPGDQFEFIPDSQWAADQSWDLRGPISPQEWRAINDGIYTLGPRQRFIVRGNQDAQFTIYPTPAAGEAGNTINWEYISNQWVIPVTWTNNTAFVAGAYCFDDGTVYKTTLGGTSSGTNPTDDVGVTWVAETDSYIDNAFTADSDQFVLDEFLLGLGMEWMWKEQKGLPYQKLEAQYERKLTRASTNVKGSKMIYLAKRPRARYISLANLPDSGYG